MKNNNSDRIENISLSAKQIKAKLEDSLAYDHDKYNNIDILFTKKPHKSFKLPFSDYKISISEEMYGQQLLLEDIKKHIENTKLIEEKVEVEIAEEVKEEIETPTFKPEKEYEEEYDDEEMHAVAPSALIEEVNNEVNIIEEICEFDEIIEKEEDYDEDEEDEEEELLYAQLPYSERAKRPKGYTIKVVDVAAVIKKIKDEAIAKNAGKPVITRRQINKLLKPYIIKKDNSMDIDGIDNTLTSIDIYLNAVDKISTTDLPTNKNSSDSLELNINEILNDLNNK